jgi:hypothetical protein
MFAHAQSKKAPICSLEFAIEFEPAALLFFRYFTAPFIFSRLSKSMSTPSSLKSTGRVGCSDSEPSFKCSSKCSFHLASTWFLLVNSSPFLARHITTCGLNGCLTSFRGLLNLRESRILRCRSISIKPSSSSCLAFFLNRRLSLGPGLFVSILGSSGFDLDGSLSGGVLFLVLLCTLLVKPLFICLFSRVDDGVCRYSLDCFFQFFTFLIQA